MLSTLKLMESLLLTLRMQNYNMRYRIKWRKGSSIIMLLTTIFPWNRSYTTFKIYGMITLCILYGSSILIRIKCEFACNALLNSNSCRQALNSWIKKKFILPVFFCYLVFTFLIVYNRKGLNFWVIHPIKIYVYDTVVTFLALKSHSRLLMANNYNLKL